MSSLRLSRPVDASRSLAFGPLTGYILSASFAFLVTDGDRPGGPQESETGGGGAEGSGCTRQVGLYGQ